MNYSAKAPVWDAQRAAPIKKEMDDSGVVIEQKIPQNPNHRICLNPSGSRVFLTLSNGPALRGTTQYGVQLLREKINAGFLPLNECPVARGYVKHDGKPCRGIDGRGNLAEPCYHLIDIETKRRKNHEKQSLEFAERMKGGKSLMNDYLRLKIKEDMTSDEKPVKKNERLKKS